MISGDLQDFTERTKDLYPLVTSDIYTKLVMLDHVIDSGFTYLDYKSRAGHARFLEWGKTAGDDVIHRKRAQWLNDYRTLTLGVGREGSTQAFIALEMDPLTTLVVFNNSLQPREIMRANLRQICEAELRTIDADWFLTNKMSTGCHPLKDIVVYVDSGYVGIKLRELLAALMSDIADLDTVRILVIQTA